MKFYANSLLRCVFSSENTFLISKNTTNFACRTLKYVDVLAGETLFK